MGVKDLWGILAPVMEHVPLAGLHGQRLAVDLSIWVVETHGVRQMQGIVTKPHLRNLFFRVSHLLQLGIDLVFVIEGEAPQLKWDTMAQRTHTRFGGRGTGSQQIQLPSKPKRSHFNAIMRECCQLLDHLGVPYVQAAGEAEAMCAHLNAAGIVDGCLTDDGDAFLYGAKKVYRNFTMNSKDPHVESYSMDDITRMLHLDRQSLVALALLLGCDYLPKGVPGVGREIALKLFTELGNDNILARFEKWTNHKDEFLKADNHMSMKKPAHCNLCSHPGSTKDHQRRGCTFCGSASYCEPQSYDYDCPCDWHNQQREVTKRVTELTVRRKALGTPGFPWPQVSREFLSIKEKASNVAKWARPSLSPFQLFSEAKMEWVPEYSQEKLLPLLSLWDMRAHCGIYHRGSHPLLEPHVILKARVRHGVACFEVQWYKSEGSSNAEDDFYTTVEEAVLVEKCFPLLVEEFNSKKPVKANKRKGKTQSSQSENSQKLIQDDDAHKENVNLMIITEALSNISLHTAGHTAAEAPPQNEGQTMVNKSSGSDITRLNWRAEEMEVNKSGEQVSRQNQTSVPVRLRPTSHESPSSTALSINSYSRSRSTIGKTNSLIDENVTSQFHHSSSQRPAVRSFSAPVINTKHDTKPTLHGQGASDSSSDEQDTNYIPLSQRLGLGNSLSLEARMASGLRWISQNRKEVPAERIVKQNSNTDLKSEMLVLPTDRSRPEEHVQSNLSMSVVRKKAVFVNTETRLGQVSAPVKTNPPNSSDSVPRGKSSKPNPANYAPTIESTLPLKCCPPTVNTNRTAATPLHDPHTSTNKVSENLTTSHIPNLDTGNLLDHLSHQSTTTGSHSQMADSSQEHFYQKVIRKKSKSRGPKLQIKPKSSIKHKPRFHEALTFSSDDESLLLNIPKARGIHGNTGDFVPSKPIMKEIHSQKDRPEFTLSRNSETLEVSDLDTDRNFEETCGLNTGRLKTDSQSNSFDLFEESLYSSTNTPRTDVQKCSHDIPSSSHSKLDDENIDLNVHKIEKSLVDPTFVDVDTPCSTPLLTLRTQHTIHGCEEAGMYNHFINDVTTVQADSEEKNQEITKDHSVPSLLHRNDSQMVKNQKRTETLSSQTDGTADCHNVSIWNTSQVGQFQIESSLLNISGASSTASTPGQLLGPRVMTTPQEISPLKPRSNISKLSLDSKDSLHKNGIIRNSASTPAVISRVNNPKYTLEPESFAPSYNKTVSESYQGDSFTTSETLSPEDLSSKHTDNMYSRSDEEKEMAWTEDSVFASPVPLAQRLLNRLAKSGDSCPSFPF